MSTSCPTEKELLAFQLGLLPLEKLEPVAAHLECCARCDAAIRNLDSAPDPVLEALRVPVVQGPAWADWRSLPPQWQVGSRLDEPTDDAAAPECWPRIPGYDVVGFLGRGGMGVVYKARDLRLGRMVAVKRLRSSDEDELRRSHREAETLAHLQHPNIVRLYDLREHDGRLYLIMELVEGEPLSKHLARPLPPRGAAALVETLARAVAYAHSHSIIHRDLKPANVMLSGIGPGLLPARERDSSGSLTLDPVRVTPKITDFGIAKRLAATAAQTRTGDLIGTPSYMAPEQAAGDACVVGPATDVYSLGVILYEMLTGRVPLLGPTTLDTLLLVRSEDPVAPRQFQPQVPRDLETICLKCLQKDPAHRYGTALELALDLARFLSGEPIDARPTPAWERAWKWTKRRPTVAGLSAAVVLVTALGLGLVAWQWQRATRAAAATATARHLAAEETRRAERMLAGASLGQGMMLCETGEVGQGLLWFDRALALAERSNELDLGHVARANLAAWRPFLVRQEAAFAHAGWTWAVAFSPDGGTAATGGSDATAQLWDTATGKPLGRPMPHSHAVWSVAFSPDGQRLLTGSGAYGGRPGEARLWDALTGLPAGPAISLPARVTAVQFSPDGRAFLTVSDLGAQVWSVATGRPLGALMSHPGLEPDSEALQKLEAVFSPDGKLVATGGVSGSARLWDAATGMPRGNHLPAAGPVISLAFSPDGRTLATGSDAGDLELWDVAVGTRRGPISRQRGKIRAIAFSPDGAITAAAGAVSLDRPKPERGRTIGGEVQLSETATGRAVGRPLWHPAPVWSVEFSPDGRILLTGCEDTAVRFFLTMSGQLVGHTHGGYGTVTAVHFSPEGTRALSSSAGGNNHSEAKLWRLSGGEALPRWLIQRGGISSLALSSDGQTLLTGSPDHSARLWDLAKGNPIAVPVAGDAAVNSVAFCPDGKGFLTVGKDGTIRLWDRETLKPRAPAFLAGSAVCGSFSSDGESFLVGDLSGRVELRETATGHFVREFAINQGPVREVAFGKGDQAFAAVSDFGVKLLDRSGLRSYGTWSSPPGGNAVAFHPNGKTVLVAHDGLAEVVDLKSEPQAHRPLVHGAGRVTRLVLSPDGRSALITGADNVTRLWDLATGRALGPPLARDEISAGQFSLNGRRLAIATPDGRVCIWDVPRHDDEPPAVRDRIELFTGLEVEGGGASEKPSGSSLDKRRDRLEQIGGNAASP